MIDLRVFFKILLIDRYDGRLDPFPFSFYG